MKYRIEMKPVRKFRPLFEAETLPEIEAWLANRSNTTWRYYGTGCDCKKIQVRGRDVAVTTQVLRGDIVEGAICNAYTETVALRSLTVCGKDDAMYSALI